MDELTGQRTGHRRERRFTAAWLVVVAGLCVGLVAWGTEIGNVLTAPAAAPPVTIVSDLEGGALFQSPSSPAPSCEFTQNDDGTVVVMSAKTGSLLSEAQAKNC